MVDTHLIESSLIKPEIKSFLYSHNSFFFIKIGQEGLYCSDECTDSGCWGAGPDQCLECRHVQFNRTCFRSCQSQHNLYTMPDKEHCGQCHTECKESCSGPESTDCRECLHVRDGRHCVAECPISKYPKNGTCVPCHDTCVGCTGPRDTIAVNGCITCEKAIIVDNKIEQCLKKDANCPGNFREFQHFINGMNMI